MPERGGEKNMPSLERRTFYMEEHIRHKVELCPLDGQQEALTVEPIGDFEIFEDGEAKIVGTYVQIVQDRQTTIEGFVLKPVKEI